MRRRRNRVLRRISSIRLCTFVFILTHRPKADRSSSIQYAKPGKTSTAYDPYATTGFQYIIDSYITPKYGDYIYQGCYSDTKGVILADRALNNKSANYGVGSVQLCGKFCDGFKYFGLENGNEYGCIRDTYISQITYTVSGYCGDVITNESDQVDCQNGYVSNESKEHRTTELMVLQLVGYPFPIFARAGFNLPNSTSPE